jgi:DNA-binding Lrp family transcriptional regulator
MDQQKQREILSLLESEARMTPAEIAPLVGEAPEAVATAIAELEEQGVLLRYTAMVDWDKVAGERVTAMIELKTHPQRDVGFDRLARRIARFVSERLSTLEGVASTTTHFVLKRYKHDGVLFGEDEPDERLAVTP